MNTFKESLDARNLSYQDAVRLGVPYHAARKHYLGERKVSAESALLYERILGIPRWELRPDLWVHTFPTAAPVSKAYHDH